MRLKVKALSAEGRFSALLLSILPFALFGLLWVIAPHFYGEVWHVALVKPLLLAAAVWMLIGDLDHVSHGEIRNLMQLVAVNLASVGRFVEANMLPLTAGVQRSVCRVSHRCGSDAGVQTRQAVRRRAIAFNPAFAGWSEQSFNPSALNAPGAEQAFELLYSVEKGLPAGGDKRVTRLRQELIRAGFFRREAIFWYYAARIGLAVVVAVVALTVLFGFVPSAPAGAVLGVTLVGAVVGLLIPPVVLAHYQRAALQQCRNGFPNFLDLLVICAEAGLTPRAGIERVSRELTRTHPFLGANLFLMCLELRAGRPLVEASKASGAGCKSRRCARLAPCCSKRSS